ncbi:glycosyltransferase [Serratia fonticola]
MDLINTHNKSVQEYNFLLDLAKKTFISIERNKLHYDANCDTRNPYNFYTLKLIEIHKGLINRLREFSGDIYNTSFFHEVSSLLAIPSQKLSGEEFIVHRIWLGGMIQESTHMSIKQWGNALDFISEKIDVNYKSILWVWEEDQLKDDPCYGNEKNDDKYTIGTYYYMGGTLAVNSLQKFISIHHEEKKSIYAKLCSSGLYSVLSDIFRISILNELGGIYIDCDTMPYKGITRLLLKPEVPNYFKYHVTSSDGLIKSKISWMNFYKDENGALISKRKNPALARALNEIDVVLSQHYVYYMENEINNEMFKELHSAIYKIWRKQLGYSLISQCDVEQKYSTLPLLEKEEIILGVNGARITNNHIDKVYLPLNEAEQIAYRECVKKINNINWSLSLARNLDEYVKIQYEMERPRVLYHPQLRHSIYHMNYYSFMSNDKNLDLLNNLYCHYMLGKNNEKISMGNYWVVPGDRKNIIKENYKSNVFSSKFSEKTQLISGEDITENHLNSMARMIFSTSYLEYCSHSNKLKSSFTELQKKQNIIPFKSLTKVLINQDGEVLAFFTSGKKKDFEAIQTSSFYRDEMELMDKKYDFFIDENIKDSDFFISTLSVSPQYRNMGVFNYLLREIKNIALNSNSTSISLTVWENSEALGIYMKKEFKIRGYSDFAYPVFFDRILFLSLDLK